MLTIWALDESGIRRGMVEPVAARAVLRDCDVGTWSFDIDMNDPMAKKITAGWSVVFIDEGVRISGLITSITASVDAQYSTMTVFGVDDNVRLEDRLVYPNPLKPATQQDRARYVVRGSAEGVLKAMVGAAAGDTAISTRKSPGLVINPNYNRGGQVAISERFSNVLEVARRIARIGGVTFNTVRGDDGQVHFDVRVPKDLTRQVRIIPQTGGAATGSVGVESATVTAAIIAGQGEGAERYINELAAPDKGRRIERLKDRRDTDEIDVVAQAAVELLSDGAETGKASLKISETVHRKFGVHFSLGDSISVQLGPATITSPVRTADITWDGFGRTVEISVGDHDQPDDKTPAWVREVKDLQTRIRGLESR
ncbi:hypothetical protein [uncultured Rothia sp.]|uniref:Gp37-like protein n=1 Tax=uncultured Rothia sp. TaxID=316088 RepID=UPI00321663DF